MHEAQKEACYVGTFVIEAFEDVNLGPRGQHQASRILNSVF